MRRARRFELCLSIPTSGPRGVCITVPPEKPRLLLVFSFGKGFKVRGDEMALTLRATEQVSVTFHAEDAKGNPAEIQDPQFEVSDPAILGLEVAADGKSAIVKGGALGTAQVTVRGDADLGEGVTPLIGVGEITVIAGEATVLAVTFGTPEPQPTP